jgi:ATP-binding cassette subfamily B protein
MDLVVSSLFAESLYCDDSSITRQISIIDLILKKLKDSVKYFRQDITRAAGLLWTADRRTTTINVGLQFVQALLPVISLYIIKLLVETAVKGAADMNGIFWLVAAFSAVQFLLALTSQYATYISTIHQQKLSDYLSGKVLSKATSVEYEYYENPAYHDTLHLAQQQSLHKATALLSNFNAVLLNSLSIMFLAIFFLSMHSLFALLFIGLFIPLAIVKWYSGYELLKLERSFAPAEREANYLHQVLTGISYAKEVRILGFGDNFIKKFKQIRSHIHQGKRNLHTRLMKYSLLAEAGEIMAMACIFGWIALGVMEKTITVGAFVVYLQGFQRLQSTSKGFLQALVQLFQQRLFLKDLFTFLDIPPARPQARNQHFPAVGAGLIVDNISFAYPDTNKPVLKDISLKCAPGNVIAIVGENGSGKSTLVKLLARLYGLQAGNIKIDGADIDNIAVPDFQDNTTFVFQDFEKYFLSIEDNITLGATKPDRDQHAIRRSAELSGADAFIQQLSAGYKTRMGRLFQGSEQLSGGQWQKLILSRIFYRNSKLIVLDEPTSALDANAELELFKNLKDHLGDKMVILISHRLYNLKLADYIYLMRDGKIAEEGTFDELTNSRGAFRQMYEAQKL